MEILNNRKVIKIGNRKVPSDINHEIVTRVSSLEEDLLELESQLQKKMCLNDEVWFFNDENLILHTDPCEPEVELDEKISINYDVTFNPQQYLNNDHSIIG